MSGARNEFVRHPLNQLEPFRYSRQGKSYQMSYHAAPEDALEDAEILREWSRKAVDAALRAARRHKGRDGGDGA